MFCFGVPLEKVFPAEGVHHSIQNFLFEAYSRISNDNLPVEEVLKKFQGSVEERLMLKQRLILGSSLDNLKISPGSLLWVVRHFIGLLPSPLLPSKDNCNVYLWLDVTRLCKASVTRYVTKGRYNSELVKILAKELTKLPHQSLNFVMHLFDIMRMLAVLPEGEPRINKVSAFALADYFSPSLFLRPFHPGSSDKYTKQYNPLTLFLLLKWPEIKYCCVQLRQIKSNSRSQSQPSRVISAKRRFVERQFTKSHSSNAKVYYHPHFDNHLRDIGCQTEEPYENCFKKCCCGVLSSHEEKKKLETKAIFIKQKCCCSYGKNYETLVSPRSFSDLEGEEELLLSDPESVGSSFILDYKKKPSAVSFAGVVKESLFETDDLYDKIRVFDPIEKETTAQGVQENVAKIGWTYSSKLIEDHCEESQQDIPKSSAKPIGWNIKSHTDESLEQIRKSLAEELKNKFSEENDDVVKDEGSRSSKSSSSSKMWDSASKESRLSGSKFKHGFNILKVFTDTRRSNSKKTLICKTESKIKYKRIGSETSIDKC